MDVCAVDPATEFDETGTGSSVPDAEEGALDGGGGEEGAGVVYCEGCETVLVGCY